MSDNKYPYIGAYGDGVVLFSKKGFGAILNKGSNHWDADCNIYYDEWHEDDFKDITREYLTKTYGKCQSQEHAEFICKLAENAGLKVNEFNYSKYRFFTFTSKTLTLAFYIDGYLADWHNERFITLPLSPKEKPMEETKPTYTKEMHERDELPPVGSFVETFGFEKISEDNFKPSTCCVIDLWGSGCKCEVVCHTEIGDQVLPVIKHDHQVSAVLPEFIKPIPTIEDDVFEIINEHIPAGWDFNRELANKLLEKYNITPKDS